MESSYDVLVVILSVTLAVLLVLAIIALNYTIKILKSIRVITDKAEHVADNIDAASEFFKKTAGPAAIGKMIANIYESMNKKDKKDGKR